MAFRRIGVGVGFAGRPSSGYPHANHRFMHFEKSEPFVAEDVLFLAVLVVKVCPFGNRASFSGVTFFRAFQLLHLLYN